MLDANNIIMKEDIQKVEEKLKELILNTEAINKQKTVLDAMNYSLEAGGKRMRPVLIIEFCKMCGGNLAQALTTACAMEMIHTFSLIHDDLPAMDDDDYRRGRLSCHKAFNEAIAILAGDALSVHAFQVILNDNNLSNDIKINVLKLLAQATGYEGMIGGQVIDIENELKNDITIDDLKSMYAKKTGALIASSCALGCIIADAPAHIVKKAYEYGINLGLAFQIIDDILDVTSSQEVLGKPIGSDKEENKTTFVTILGIEEAKKQAKQATENALAILKELPNNSFLTDLTKELLTRKK